jgi:hypothetical protein
VSAVLIFAAVEDPGSGSAEIVRGNVAETRCVSTGGDITPDPIVGITERSAT